MEDFRGFLKRLEQNQELARIQKPVDARYISSLVAQAEQALFFENVRGFAFPVASGVVGTRRRIALALDCPETVPPRVAPSGSLVISTKKLFEASLPLASLI